MPLVGEKEVTWGFTTKLVELAPAPIVLVTVIATGGRLRRPDTWLTRGWRTLAFVIQCRSARNKLL